MISSRSNAQIKNIRSLSRHKARKQSGLFLAEGLRLVTEAVQTGAEIETLVYAPDLLTSENGLALIEEQEQRGIRCLSVTPEVFKSFASKDNPQGIAAVVRQQWTVLENIHPGDELCWVALDAVQDPGNVGTVLRTCDAVGAAGIILLGNSTDPYHPTALRASMGALFSLRIARAEFAEFLEWVRDRGYTLVGAAGDAPTSCREVEYRPPLVLLMGSERKGLSPEQQAECDVLGSIPMVGRSDSLNLAVATGVLLYEIFQSAR